MAAGGNAYGSKSSQGRASAETAQAWGSGTGDTNSTNLLNLVSLAADTMPPTGTGSCGDLHSS